MKTFWKAVIAASALLCLIASAGLIYLLVSEFSVNQLPVIGQKVAVIPVKGEITAEGCGGSIFGVPECANVKSIKERLRSADEDASVRAIVLDIDSGGGEVVPSAELSRAVKETKKPVVACIRSTGASGAYYVASAADHIVADRDSITGSIGVIMSVTHTYGLYEKLGLNVTVIKAGDVKDIGSPNRPMTEEEKEELKGIVDEIYTDFIGDVAENRNLSVSYVKELADGSLYLGKEAKDLGLIDSLGGIEEAVSIAAEMGGITGEPVVEESSVQEATIWGYFA